MQLTKLSILLKNIFWQKTGLIHTRIIGAQCAMTTPILLFPANRKKYEHNFRKCFKKERNIASSIRNTIREKLIPLECPDQFSHYIFCWLYQRLDLQPSKRMNKQY
jgi:hypothetical protein